MAAGGRLKPSLGLFGLAMIQGVSNHWNGIRTGLDWTGME